MQALQFRVVPAPEELGWVAGYGWHGVLAAGFGVRLRSVRQAVWLKAVQPSRAVASRVTVTELAVKTWLSNCPILSGCTSIDDTPHAREAVSQTGRQAVRKSGSE